LSFFPQFLPHHPPKETIEKWDQLLLTGKKVVAIGGSDSHALNFSLGFIKRQIFPYEFHFQAVNTHILLKENLSGDVSRDRLSVLHALRNGNAFVGYDLPASTSGFRFSAQGKNQTAWMGEDLELGDGATLQIRLPLKTECKLIWNGKTIKTWNDKEICTQFINKPGIYRVECSINYLGKKRSWIYSNPIYIR
ncbi:MAG: hypothetical protein JEZ06_24680, partial [Anaerolineaceae bacterium]|nr:hypothetical protein [Anaerolineaceae bacterium]